MRVPSTAVALALLFAVLVAAGCGLGPGEGVDEAELTVTQDYGNEPVLHRQLGDLNESDTVMRALEGSAKITTRYGGGFVQSIEGQEGEGSGDSSRDWFFFVNGVESTVGAADYPLHGGESIWWDYRNWSAAMRVPAVVGSWPQPFLDGYDGKARPVAVECLGGGSACAEVEERLEDAGASVASGSPSGAIRVLVGPWAKVREDPAAAQIEDGSQASGVFADFYREGGGYHLTGLNREGETRFYFGVAAGLVAATRRYEAPPTWLVTGATNRGVHAAAGALNAADLRDHYAVIAEGELTTSLPVR